CVSAVFQQQLSHALALRDSRRTKCGKNGDPAAIALEIWVGICCEQELENLCVSLGCRHEDRSDAFLPLIWSRVEFGDWIGLVLKQMCHDFLLRRLEGIVQRRPATFLIAWRFGIDLRS